MLCMKTIPPRFASYAIILTLIIATLGAYWQLNDNGFITSYDDKQYILENSRVCTGLSWDNIVWAFTTQYAANWHPLTWISHMVDVELFGFNPGGSHLVNLTLHILNALLLFLFLKTSTGALWRSALVAALFALHPLHVESVAWAAERKDVLCAFFWLAAMLTYQQYSASSRKRFYWFTVVLFALGLLAKPMIVTFPLVLLLLDCWPLRRCPRPSALWRLGIEKIPFLILSLCGGILTLHAQHNAGAVVADAALPIGLRLANALAAYVLYLQKMVWPLELAVLYPHPGFTPKLLLFGAGTAIAAISVCAVIVRRWWSWFLIGWLWYVVTLLPVIGIIQVGVQAMADRYTYLPLIGIFIIIAWSAEALSRRFGASVKTALIVASMGALLGCGILTCRQVGVWKDSVTLFEHTVAVTRENFIAHNNLGIALRSYKRYDEALAHFDTALTIEPNYAACMVNIGVTWVELGDLDKATLYFEKALSIQPYHVLAMYHLGSIAERRGDPATAIQWYRRALQDEIISFQIRNNLGVLYAKQADYANALQLFTDAIRLQPTEINGYLNRATAYLDSRQDSLAMADIATIFRLFPGDTVIRNTIATILADHRRLRPAPSVK
jgi:tetratricopeptide (TPR) repeat protein